MTKLSISSILYIVLITVFIFIFSGCDIITPDGVKSNPDTEFNSEYTAPDFPEK